MDHGERWRLDERRMPIAFLVYECMRASMVDDVRKCNLRHCDHTND